MLHEEALEPLDHVGDGDAQRERRHIEPDVLDLRERGPRRRGDDGAGCHTEHAPNLHGGVRTHGEDDRVDDDGADVEADDQEAGLDLRRAEDEHRQHPDHAVSRSNHQAAKPLRQVVVIQPVGQHPDDDQEEEERREAQADKLEARLNQPDQEE